MKHKIFQFISAVFCIFALTACPYSSDYPLDAGGYIPIQDNMLGEWKVYGADAKELKVSEIDNFTIKVSDANVSYRGHFSNLNGVLFINVKTSNSDGTSGKIFIFKVITVSTKEIYLYPLTENIKTKFSSSAQLKEYVKANLDNDLLYEEPLRYRKV